MTLNRLSKAASFTQRAGMLVATAMLLAACGQGDGSEHAGSIRASVTAAASNDKKAEICHTGQTISVSQSAIPAHLKHGDVVGPCPSPCSPSSCDDGDLCTSDTCTAAGACEHAAVSCDDGNVCTADACDAQVGCVNTPVDQTPCSDGNDCTATDVCTAGRCAGRPVAGCCSNDTACSDGNSCTLDRCQNGACTNAPVDCSLANRCVAGFCDPTTGACGTTPVSCDDSNACTLDACDSAQGCSSAPVADGTPCEDAGCSGASCPARSCQSGSCTTTAVTVRCDDPASGTEINLVPGAAFTFRGTVLDTHGVHEVRVNGVPVAFADDGTFSAALTAHFGANVVEVVATGRGTSTTTLCSFVASDTWSSPTATLAGEASLRLSQGAIDDGDHGSSIDSLGDALAVANDAESLRAALDTNLSAANPLKPNSCDSQTCTFLGCICWYSSEVTYRSVEVTSAATSATLVSGGISSKTTAEDVRVELRVRGKIAGIAFDTTGWVTLTEVSVGSIHDVAVQAGLPRVSVRPGSVVASAGTISTDFNGVDGWIIDNILVPLAEGYLRDAVRDVVRNSATNRSNAVLDGIISSLDVRNVGSSSLVPKLDGSGSLSMGFGISFSSVNFTTSRGLFGMGYRWTSPPSHPDHALGVAIPAGAQLLDPSTTDAAANATSIAALDQVLYALWRSGYFDEAVTTSTGTVTLAAELPPTVSLDAVGGTELRVGGFSAVVAVPGVPLATRVAVAADLTSPVELVGDAVRLTDLHVAKLYVSTPETRLSDDEQTALEGALSEAILIAMQRATADGLPAWPRPVFTIPATLSALGLPGGQQLGIVAPALSFKPRHLVIGGSFGAP